ncbi:MAG: hypothetical protein NTY30_03930 [Candidatus Berkelbacteria bacterium]|nr:hypothetical protein [Candidatus Berkelbacteria bacterium]
MDKTPKNQLSILIRFSFCDSNAQAIDLYTRNACVLAQAEIITFILGGLCPGEPFEILTLPPQSGSFKDLTVVKLLNNNTGCVAALSVLLMALLFSSQLKVNNTTSDLNVLEIVEKCKNYGVSEELTEKVKNICSSYYPKKQKNIFYESVIADESVTSIKPTITEDHETFEKEINRSDFREFIEEIPKEKEYLKTDLLGHIQLSQPFIEKQQQYGRGVAWKGMYFGEDVVDDRGEIIIEDGENIFFYMQDDEYKDQILKQEVSFTSGDNIGVIFDVNRYYDYIESRYGKPRLYVKKVTSHNDNLVEHKKELEIKRQVVKREKQNKNQKSLFENIET